MVTALATMFKLAVQRGWMLSNPATGIAHAYKRTATPIASGGRRNGSP
jgi:hypothetical protein